MEPLNKGHVGTRTRRTNKGFLYLEVKMYWYNRNWDKLYIDLSFIERFSLFGVSFIGGSTVCVPTIINKK